MSARRPAGAGVPIGPSLSKQLLQILLKGRVDDPLLGDDAGDQTVGGHVLLDHMLLNQLLDSLSETERELIEMRYFQDKTQTEVAGVLGISQVQVSRLEKKILLRMREQLVC